MGLDVRSVLAARRPSSASVPQCDRCNGAILTTEDGRQYQGGGTIDYVTWDYSEKLWFVEQRLCECVIGKARGALRIYRHVRALADARWFHPSDTWFVYFWRAKELETGIHRTDAYRAVLESVGSWRKRSDGEPISIDEELARVPRDRWGDDWWKYPPKSEWENPAWNVEMGST